jgi:hypothetical protein
VVKVFKALDAERFLRHVTAYKELVDKKAAAIVEDAEREFREKRTATVEEIKRLSEQYGESLGMVLQLMPWVPKSHRALVIAQTKLPDPLKKGLADWAAGAPEWSAGGLVVVSQATTTPWESLSTSERACDPAPAPK